MVRQAQCAHTTPESGTDDNEIKGSVIARHGYPSASSLCIVAWLTQNVAIQYKAGEMAFENRIAIA